MVGVLWGLGGMVALLAVAVAFSTDRTAIRWRTVLGALAIQVVFAVVVLFWDAGQAVLEGASRAVQAVIDSSSEGIAFVFGPALPEEGLVFAFQVLPVIIFFAALTAVLYHLGILQRVVRVVGGGLAWVLGTTRPESMNAAANIFVGQTEAPLVIRPYLARMNRSELFAVMVGGLTTVAGSVLVGYSLLGAELRYLIAASFMAAPAALMMAKIVVPADRDRGPSTEEESAPLPRSGGAVDGADRAPGVDALDGASRRDDDGPVGGGTAGDARRARAAGGATASGRAAGDGTTEDEVVHRNVIDAAAQGASDGLRLALNVGAMLIAFISLIALLNLVLGAVGGLFGAEDLTFQQVLGYVFAPVMFVVGVPWDEAVAAGSYLGQKVILNEFVAFSDFGPDAGTFSTKAQAVITFALTGFANLGSLAILLGGLGSLAPAQRPVIASLGLRAVLCGTLGNLMSAAIAGILIG
ncbi:NupC/NupG family nucleoside CNT transporter [Geodermatophilus sp. SYSU D00758]